MTSFANDLHIEGRIANDLHEASDQLIIRHPAAMMAAARIERSKELARLFKIASRAIRNLFRATDGPKDATATTRERVPANANKIDKHDLAA